MPVIIYRYRIVRQRQLLHTQRFLLRVTLGLVRPDRSYISGTLYLSMGCRVTLLAHSPMVRRCDYRYLIDWLYALYSSRLSTVRSRFFSSPPRTISSIYVFFLFFDYCLLNSRLTMSNVKDYFLGGEHQDFVGWHKAQSLDRALDYIRSPSGVQARHYVHVVRIYFIFILFFIFFFLSRSYLKTYFLLCWGVFVLC